MDEFLIGDVCRFLNVKPHIVRYWEQRTPLLQSNNYRDGRRIYNYQDLQVLFRFKYLIYNKMYTLEGAAQQIIDEAYGESAHHKTEIHLLREKLLVLFKMVHHSNEKLGDTPKNVPIINNEKEKL